MKLLQIYKSAIQSKQANKGRGLLGLTTILLVFLFVLIPAVFAQETTITYPSKYYNIDSNGKITKHIFANGIEIATVAGTGGEAKVEYLHPDNLGSTGVVTNSTGAIIETVDYFPFGEIRVDKKATSFSEQRKYIGQEYDVDTKLNYLNARYYDSATGKFLSQDPVFWQLSKELLLDPQQQNSYSYARNNPITYIDSDGKKVYAIAKAIEANSIGTHIFLLMVPDNPSDFGINSGEGWTLGGYAGDAGNLIKARNAPSDVSVVQNGYSIPDQKLGRLKDKVEVMAPGNISDSQFIKDITNYYNSYKEDAAYDAFAGNGYNSNNFATSMLKNSGVQKLPWNGNAPGMDPGFGEALPNNYIKADGNKKAQGFSAISGYGSRETGKQINGFVQNVGNIIKNNATKAWNSIRGK